MRRMVLAALVAAGLASWLLWPDRSFLLRRAETARAEGAEQMELGTSEADTAALALYESAGFTNREGTPDGPVMLFYEREL